MTTAGLWGLVLAVVTGLLGLCLVTTAGLWGLLLGIVAGSSWAVSGEGS